MAEKTLPRPRHESSDIGPAFVWIACFGLLAALAACGLLVYWLYPHATLDRVLRMPLLHFPDPQLQSDPAAEMAAFHAAQIQLLNSTGWVDRARGVVHIPIADAMRQTAKAGIPGWPTQ